MAKNNNYIKYYNLNVINHESMQYLDICVYFVPDKFCRDSNYYKNFFVTVFNQ